MCTRNVHFTQHIAENAAQSGIFYALIAKRQNASVMRRQSEVEMCLNENWITSKESGKSVENCRLWFVAATLFLQCYRLATHTLLNGSLNTTTLPSMDFSSGMLGP